MKRLKKLFNLKAINKILIISSLVPFPVFAADNQASSPAFKSETSSPAFEAENFSMILGILKQRLPGEYLPYCGNEENKLWEKAGWFSKKSCLHDGRSHVIYKTSWKGEPEDDFDKKHDLANLAQAVKNGAEISITEEGNENWSANYKCGRVLVNGASDRVNCSTVLHKHLENGDYADWAKEFERYRLSWLMIDTNGIRQTNHLNFMHSEKDLKITEHTQRPKDKVLKSYTWHVKF